MQAEQELDESLNRLLISFIMIILLLMFMPKLGRLSVLHMMMKSTALWLILLIRKVAQCCNWGTKQAPRY